MLVHWEFSTAQSSVPSAHSSISEMKGAGQSVMRGAGSDELGYVVVTLILLTILCTVVVSPTTELNATACTDNKCRVANNAIIDFHTIIPGEA